MIATAGQTSRETEVQSGDTQGLSKAEQTNSESVEELAADGQAFEASAVSGLEDAADPVHRDMRIRAQPRKCPFSAPSLRLSAELYGRSSTLSKQILASYG